MAAAATTSATHELGAEFTRREIMPHLQQWEDDLMLPRDLHVAAAKQGVLGVGFPEEVGGQGGDLLDTSDLQEGMFEAGASSGLMAGLFTHGIALPHIISSGDAGLIRSFRPADPGRRADRLAGRHRARRGLRRRRDPHHGTARIRRGDGDHYVVNGAKTFITSGIRADFVTTAVRTGGPGHAGVSLLVVEKGTPGFTVDRALTQDGLALLRHRRAVVRRRASPGRQPRRR